MAPPRADAIILCSCGARWGNARRGAMHEDMEAVEHALLGQYVAKMVKHWRLGHEVKLRPGAPLSYAALVAKAALAMRDEEPEAGGDPGHGQRRIGAIED